MLNLLWNDCEGGIITTELLLISSVVVAGLLTGLNTFRTNVEEEFELMGKKIQQQTQMLQPVKSAPEIHHRPDSATAFYSDEFSDFLN